MRLPSRFILWGSVLESITATKYEFLRQRRADHAPSCASSTDLCLAGTCNGHAAWDGCQTLIAAQHIVAGQVCVEKVNGVFKVTYDTSSTDWELIQVHAHFATSLGGFPLNNKGHPKIGHFDIKDSCSSPNVYTFDVSFDDICLECTAEGETNPSSFLLATHAVVKKGGQEETAWGEGEKFCDQNNWATYFQVCTSCDCYGAPVAPPTDSPIAAPTDSPVVPPTDPPTVNGDTAYPTKAPTKPTPRPTKPPVAEPTKAPVAKPPTPPPGEGCETAFALAADVKLDTCFLDIDVDLDGKVDFDRWGWTIGPITKGFLGLGTTLTLDLYAAAGDCDLGLGRKVGTVDLYYTALGVVLLTNWVLETPYKVCELQWYAGKEILPLKDGLFTCAPGHYPVENKLSLLHDTLDPIVSAITGLSGDIYVAIHLQICGFPGDLLPLHLGLH